MALPRASGLHTLRPRLLDAFLERLTHVRRRVDDPHAVGRVERHGEEDGVRVGLAEQERQGVFARVCDEYVAVSDCTRGTHPSWTCETRT